MHGSHHRVAVLTEHYYGIEHHARSLLPCAMESETRARMIHSETFSCTLGPETHTNPIRLLAFRAHTQ
jgi:hypothetical protein